MATKITIEIGCEPGSETCGECGLRSQAGLCSLFGVLRWESDYLRPDACKSAEKAEIPLRPCGCPSTGPRCHCERDE